MKKFIFALALLLNIDSFATVRILTFHYNQPDFLEMQYKTMKKFLKDDFELIVFNDAKTVENEQGIENICKQYGIKCVRFKPEWHLIDPLNNYLKGRLQEPSTIGTWNWKASTSIEEIASNPSVRHCHVIQYALDHYGYDHDDIVVIWDGDNFPIKPVSVRELLGDNDLIAFNQAQDPKGKNRRQLQLTVPKNQEMYWVVFMAFNPRKLPNPHELHLNVDVISGQPHLENNKIGDTGAAIYKYLQKYPNLKTQTYWWQDSWELHTYFSYQDLKMLGCSDALIWLAGKIAPAAVQLFVFEHFVHFAAVSAETPYHQHKLHYFRIFINDVLED